MAKIRRLSGKNPSWRNFEKRVAKIYRNLGALDVEVDKNISGHQIDVYALVPANDGTIFRHIISCKCYSRVVGIDAVKELDLVFSTLRHVNKADAAVLVSKSGFSRQARELAKDVGIHLKCIDELEHANIDVAPYLIAIIGKFSEERVFKCERYIPLRCKTEDNDLERPLAQVVRRFLSGRNTNLLTLLGDYGSGKTTFCRFIFQELANEYLSNAPNSRAPVYLSLRDYPDQLNLRGFILDVLVNQHDAKCPNYSTFQKMFVDGKVVLLLDAFDEMETRVNYQATMRNFRAIQELCEGKAKIILTCRTHFFKSDDEVHEIHKGDGLYTISQKENYTIATVQAFNVHEIEQYVRNVCGEEWRNAYIEIKNTYNLMDLAKQPILLNMITEVLPDLVKSGTPINSVNLYKFYTEHWLQRDDWRVLLPRLQRTNFTVALAYATYSQERKDFSWQDVQAAIRQHFPTVHSTQLIEYENDIRTCTFIKRIGDKFEFVHYSFVEYFVATKLYGDILANNRERFEAIRHSKEILGFLSQCPSTKQAIDTIRQWLNNRVNPILTSNVMPLLVSWETCLTGAFKKTRVHNHSFSKSNVINWDLEEVECDSLKWSKANWDKVKASNCNWKNCLLDTCSVKSLVSQGDSWIDVVFRGCTIKSSKWINCTITSVEFHGALFEKIEWERCAFSHVDIEGVSSDIIFRNCSFSNDTLIEGIKANFYCCEFKDCRLDNCCLQSCSLPETTFTNCSFRNITWDVKSLDEVTFVNVDFGESVVIDDSSISGKRNRKIWRVPPKFIGDNKIPRKLLEVLKSHGAKFVKQQRK